MSGSSNKDVNFSFKVVINKQKTKVLFAAIDNYFADVLFSFLTLPLGKIVQHLEKHYGDEAAAFGSLTTLYDSLSNLDGAHFCADGCKKMLLNPAHSFIDECCKLKLDIGDTQPTNYFSCGRSYCARHCENILISMYNGTGTARCECGGQLNKTIPVRNVSQAVVGEVFTNITSSFVLSDDLEILPNGTTSVRQIFSNLGLFDIDGIECRNVTFGSNEVMDLLKWSLLTRTPLTNVILEKQRNLAANRFLQIETPSSPTSVAVALTVKVVFQKSSNNVLFVEAEDDFVDFLFSWLVIPLGKVESLLGGNTCLTTIDNLYRSIASPINSKYLRKVEKTKLINPTVPHGYLSNIRIFSLVEEGTPNLYLHRGCLAPHELHLSPISSLTESSFKSPKGEGNYVMSPSKYMVKDDLTVTPVCMASYISTISEQKIPLSDVEELVLKIGLQEASSILNASLSSTRALSHGFSHLLKKKPKLGGTLRIDIGQNDETYLHI